MNTTALTTHGMPETMVKYATREQLHTMLEVITEPQRLTRSTRACRALADTDEFRTAGNIMLFLTIPNEIDTAEAIEQALQAGKTVTVPKTIWAQRQLIPITLTSLDEPMTVTQAGLRWPRDGKPLEIAQLDMVIVPGMGFDHTGNRLGRGGGFYDRLLSHPDFNAVTCGLAFQEQLLEACPVHEHDVPLDMLVTDETVLRFRQ